MKTSNKDLIYKDNIANKHEILRGILINTGATEYGDSVIDEICELLNFPTTLEE